MDLVKDKDKAAMYREEIVKRINELKPLNKKTGLLEGIVKPALAADDEGFITMGQFGRLEEIVKRKQELNKLIKANEKSRLVSPVDVGSLRNELGALEEERKRIVTRGTTPRPTPSPTPEKRSYTATQTPYNNTIKREFGKNFVDATIVLKRRNDEGKLVGENVALGTDLTTSNEGYDEGKLFKKSPGDVLGKDGLWHSQDRGLFRINSRHFSEAEMKKRKSKLDAAGITGWDDMLDPEKNIKMAKILFDERGWDPWYAAPAYLLSGGEIKRRKEIEKRTGRSIIMLSQNTKKVPVKLKIFDKYRA